MYLYPQYIYIYIYIYISIFHMWKGHIVEVHCTNIQRKGSSSNEIILHKFQKNKWVWEDFREDYCTPALFARDYRDYLDSLLSDPLLWNGLFHYLMNPLLWMLVQWTSKLCPFHISMNIFLGYRYTLSLPFSFNETRSL